MKAPKFEIHKIYQEEAHRILSARRSGKILHEAGDIPASGDEVEVAFRDFLKRKEGYHQNSTLDTATL